MVDDNRRKLEPGKRLNIPDRVSEREKQFREPGSNFRKRLNGFLANRRIEPPNDNIDTNTVAGGLATYIIYILEDYLPVRSGASTDIIDMEEDGNTLRYTIDTNAPLESQARFKSILTSGTGITSLWVDDFEIEEARVTKERPLRDTYRYVITVNLN